MRHSQTLERDLAAGGNGELEEHRAWVTGTQVFTEANAAGRRTPILFSAAETWSGLLFSAIVDDIDVIRNDDGSAVTRCRYSGLRRIDPPRPLSTLRLRSTRKPLSDSYIRPYAICQTPSFLDA
jgi:hypothetical protein